MEKFAVIDTETNWKDEVMSIGVVIADADTFNVCKMKYYILAPEYLDGGMYSCALKIKWDFDCNAQECSREKALTDLKECLQENQISKIFAYNASFDYHHLPELNSYTWYDIMRLAAYRQYNSKISQDADLYSTGRLKRGFGVECMKELLTGVGDEKHNALCDAVDELLGIMKPLGYKIEEYIPYIPKNRFPKKINIQSTLEFHSANNSYIITTPTLNDIYLAVEQLSINSNNYIVMRRTPTFRNITQVKVTIYDNDLLYRNSFLNVYLQCGVTLTNKSVILYKQLTVPETKRFLFNYNKGKMLNLNEFEIFNS